MSAFTNVAKLSVIVIAMSACARQDDAATGSAASPLATPATAMPVSPMTLPSAMTTSKPVSPPIMTSAGASLNSADQAFLAVATHSNEAVIDTTALGMARGGAKAKALSETLNADHIALRATIAALMPDAPEQPAVAAPGALAGLRGKAFDRAMLDVLQQQHETAIRSFMDAGNNPALSEAVRSFARNTLPALQAHLKAIEDMQRR